MGSTLERGTLLHKRYRIVEILGQGGMGSVYRAVDENLGVDVAVKENLFASDEYARQFRLEAVLLANLRHAHLPRVTDHFVIDNQGQYLIMDYIEGEDLRQRMERVGSVSEQEALLIGVAMCDALEYLHTRKPSVIHRDVKPGNVRIAPDGHIYLVDFGLAKLVKGSQATTTGARAMTPGYSPPEQYGTARTDPRTDVYSLGATLYAALTGVIPEDGLARAMDNIELTPLRKRNPGVSRKLASAIEKAMAVRPDDRYQSADEFKQALVSSNVKTQKLEGDLFLPPLLSTEEDKDDIHLSHELVPPGNEPPEDVPPLKPYRKKRRRAGPWVALFLSMLAVIAAVFAVAMYWTPISAKLLAILVTPTPTQVVALTIPDTEVVDPAALERSSTPTRMTPTTKNSRPVNTSTTTLTKTATPLVLPTITPTWTATTAPTSTLPGGGYSQVAFASLHGGFPQIYIASLETGGKTSLHQLTNMTEGACQPNWSPDGQYVVFISPCRDQQNEYPSARLYVIKADGSGFMGLPYSESGDFDPAWSPDGQSIAFTSMRDGLKQIYVMKLPEYTITQLTQKSTDARLPDWSEQPSWSPDGSQIVYTGHGRLTDATQIWVMSSVGTGQKILIPRGPTYWDFSPTWSPDGKTILFNETEGAQTMGWLMLFDYEHLDTAQATHLRSGTYANHGRYSQDGEWVLYESINVVDVTDSNHYVYIMKNENGSNPFKIETTSSLNFDPAWRPKK